MPKRKITVTVDQELVDLIQALGVDMSLSGVVNEALGVHVERLGRLAALRELLDGWDERYGPVSAAAGAEARDAFDELDGVMERADGVVEAVEVGRS